MYNLMVETNKKTLAFPEQAGNANVFLSIV